MSDQALRDAVARMATDPAFRAAIRDADPSALAGYELTSAELAALQSLSVETGAGGAEPLGARLSRSSMFFGGTLSALHMHDAGSAHPDPSAQEGDGSPDPHDV